MVFFKPEVRILETKVWAKESSMIFIFATTAALALAPGIVTERKRNLLAAVSTLKKSPSVAARNAVLSGIADLEACNVIDAAPDGRWSLIFSTQENAPDANRPGANILQPLIDATCTLSSCRGRTAVLLHVLPLLENGPSSLTCRLCFLQGGSSSGRSPAGWRRRSIQ